MLDDEEWGSKQPFFFRNAVDLAGEPATKQLSAGGQEVQCDGNLNDGSLYSEIFAYEMLYRCEGAELFATEGEVVYTDPDGKKTDLLVGIDKVQVGVSVTRAYHYPRSGLETPADAPDASENWRAEYSGGS